MQLAVDEAMLDACEAGFASELLRLWQFDQPVAVLGRGSRVDVEIDTQQCRRESIAVLRRCSGGASIVAGPGCLMYSLVLDLQKRPDLRRLDVVHPFVMQRLADALAPHLDDIRVQGICDLTWRERKFSGNSLRVARNHLLYHGTLLYDGDLDQIDRCLKTPPRQPDYRRLRDHRSFITNIPLDQPTLIDSIRNAFQSCVATGDWKSDGFDGFIAAQAETLDRQRYSQPDWNHRH
jgi:lipoate-protein ligase A